MDEPSPTISTPSYRIFRDKHGIPQFSPKRGTQALNDALVYSFPTLETELQLMQAALKKFFDSERGIQMICELPENNLQNSLAKKRDIEVSPIQEQKAGLRNWKLGVRPTSRLTSRTTSRAPSRNGSRAGSRPSSRASSCAREGSVDVNGVGFMSTWSLDSGRELERKKKSPYDPVKRRKVAENRGNACEKHRAAKSACDPLTCRQNKMFGKTQDAVTASQPNPGPSTQKMVPDSPMQIDAPMLDVFKSLPEPAFDTPCINFVNSPPDTDVFWDALDLGDSTNTSLNFNLSTSSYTDSWNGSSQTDLLSWSPNSSCLTAPEVTNMDFSTTVPKETRKNSSSTTCIPTMTEMDFQVDENDTPLPIPHTCPLQQYPSLSFSATSEPDLAQQDLSDTIVHNNQTLTCSEDPFMGWASKKANHMFDEYNWVLSHVETL